MPGMIQMLGDSSLGDTVTKVVSVKPCKSDSSKCCAERRGMKNGSEKKGDFEALCAKQGLRFSLGKSGSSSNGNGSRKVPVVMVAQEDEITRRSGDGAYIGGLSMARRKHSRRHMSLAEYGEPMGDIGFLADLADMDDIKSAGWILGSGVVTLAVAPPVINFIDGILPDMLKPYSGYIKGIVAVGGGFAAYKYGRKYNHDAAVGAGAVLMGLGTVTIAKQLANKFAPTMSKYVPAGLGYGMPEEAALMAALDAVASSGISADMDPAFGGWYDPGFNAIDASVEEEGAYDEDGGQLRGGNWYGGNNLDAFVTDPNALEADVEDADAYMDNDGEYIESDGMQF
jgi:hypothetical protein